jgi:hypothetical protein
MVTKLFGLAAGILALSGFASAHGSHSSDQAPSDDWATRHMMGKTQQLKMKKSRC